MFSEKYKNQIYSGVLGKIIGVYLGRPVEGWSYKKIMSNFDEIQYYINDVSGAPLIVPDDDISGTFSFFRALEDNGFDPNISSKIIGKTWLNYIIEDKTILWWGGLYRSTEHTAFLRLKNGINAPSSGSSKLNGLAMATQIGAQIFIDSWAMANPGNPERAANMAREAARVSHDDIAVESAAYLASIQSMAFDETAIDYLLDEGLKFVSGKALPGLVNEIRNICSKANYWQDVREYIAQYHGYDRYFGNCPIITNHLVVLMALILGDNDFQRSIGIAASAGWDTDCNAGNLGCLNGIRLGLEGIDAGANLRRPVADRILVVSSDGGACYTDAVIESRKIITAAARLDGLDYNIRQERFAFEFPGSIQGFRIPDREMLAECVVSLENALDVLGRSGLLIRYKQISAGTCGKVFVDTYNDLIPKGIEGTSYFEVLSSPSIYPTQRINAVIEGLQESSPKISIYIHHYVHNGDLKVQKTDPFTIEKGLNTISWQVPDTSGYPIYQVGLELTSDKRLDGAINLVSMDWSNEPSMFHMPRSYQMSPSLTPWTTTTPWLESFMSSASNFYPDYTTTFSLSHQSENGVVTIGSTDWRNYKIESTLIFIRHEGAGLVARSKGHHRYYAGIIQDSFARIIKHYDGEVTVLAEKDLNFTFEARHKLSFTLEGSSLMLSVDDNHEIHASDKTFNCGGAGFIVNSGAILIDGLTIGSVR